MHIVRYAESQAVETPGKNCTRALVTVRSGAAESSVLVQRQEPGGFNPPHYHDREEILVLRSGRLAVTVGEVEAELGAGDALVVPARTIHNLRNAGDEAAEWILVSPLGAGFFRPDGEQVAPVWG